MKRIRYILFGLLAATILAACGQTSVAVSNQEATQQPEAAQTYTPDKPTQEPIHTPTATLEPTPTYTPTATLEPELYTLSFLAFHDYNGNGTMDEGEPALEGILNKTSAGECTTDAEGKCEIEGLLPKNYKLTVDSSKSSVEGLDFMFYGTDVLNPKKGIDVKIEGDTTADVALGQGPLPLPIQKSSYSHIIKGYGAINDDGSTHEAIDFVIIGENPQIVYANISGIVETIPGSSTSNPFGDCNLVVIDYRGTIGNFNVGLGHLTKVYVTPGQLVETGTPIGEIDPTLYTSKNLVACTDNPHLEYYVFGPTGKNGSWGFLNPEIFSPKTGVLVPSDYTP